MFINMILGELTIDDVEVIVLPAAVTDLEFVVSVLYAAGMMANGRTESVTKVDLSSVLTAVMTVLEFTMPASLEESLVFD